MRKGALLSYSVVSDRVQLCSDLHTTFVCLISQSMAGGCLWEEGDPNLPGKVTLISQGQLS